MGPHAKEVWKVLQAHEPVSWEERAGFSSRPASVLRLRGLVSWGVGGCLVIREGARPRVLWSEGLEAAEVRRPWTEAWGRATPTPGVCSPPPPGERSLLPAPGPRPTGFLSPHPRLVWPLGGAGISEVPQTHALGPQVPLRFQGQLWGSLGADDLAAA